MDLRLDSNSRRTCSAVLLSLLMLLPASRARAQTNADIPPADAGDVANANFEFAIDLYKQLAKDQQKGANLFFSPFSVSSALAILAEGAHGRTAEQMNAVLHFYDALRVNHPDAGAEPNLLPIHQTMAWTARHWPTPAAKDADPAANWTAPYELSIANTVSIEQTWPIAAGFKSTIEKHYGANAFRQADFAGNPEQERQKINALVRAQTQEKIVDLIPQDAITPLTRLLLTNAAYFKGAWVSSFPKAATSRQTFHVDATRNVQSSLMHLTPTKLRFYATARFQALALPYRGKSREPSEMSMIILLPAENDELPYVERLIDAKRLNDWLPQMAEQLVEVYLPRFQMTGQYDLSDSLERMGMSDAFASRADFSGISPEGKRDQMHISHMLHKTYVDVQEDGTEAAAATGAIGAASGRGREIRPPVFRADHPFLFIIYHHPTGTILFMGRVNNPAA